MCRYVANRSRQPLAWHLNRLQSYQVYTNQVSVPLALRLLFVFFRFAPLKFIHKNICFENKTIFMLNNTEKDKYGEAVRSLDPLKLRSECLETNIYRNTGIGRRIVRNRMPWCDRTRQQSPRHIAPSNRAQMHFWSGAKYTPSPTFSEIVCAKARAHLIVMLLHCLLCTSAALVFAAAAAAVSPLSAAVNAFPRPMRAYVRVTHGVYLCAPVCVSVLYMHAHTHSHSIVWHTVRRAKKCFISRVRCITIYKASGEHFYAV